MDRQIRYWHLELTVGLGRVGLAEPLIQLPKVDAPVACGNRQPLGDSLPVRICCPRGERRLLDMRRAADDADGSRAQICAVEA